MEAAGPQRRGRRPLVGRKGSDAEHSHTAGPAFVPEPGRQAGDGARQGQAKHGGPLLRPAGPRRNAITNSPATAGRSTACLRASRPAREASCAGAQLRRPCRRRERPLRAALNLYGKCSQVPEGCSATSNMASPMRCNRVARIFCRWRYSSISTSAGASAVRVTARWPARSGRQCECGIAAESRCPDDRDVPLEPNYLVGTEMIAIDMPQIAHLVLILATAGVI